MSYFHKLKKLFQFSKVWFIFSCIMQLKFDTILLIILLNLIPPNINIISNFIQEKVSGKIRQNIVENLSLEQKNMTNRIKNILNLTKYLLSKNAQKIKYELLLENFIQNMLKYLTFKAWFFYWLIFFYE